MSAIVTYFRDKLSSTGRKDLQRLSQLRDQVQVYYSDLDTKELASTLTSLLRDICSTENSNRTEVLIELLFTRSKAQLSMAEDNSKSEGVSLVDLLNSDLSVEALTFLKFLLFSSKEHDALLLDRILDTEGLFKNFLLLELVGSKNSKRIKALWKEQPSKMEQICERLEKDSSDLLSAFKMEDDEEESDDESTSLDNQVLESLEDLSSPDNKVYFFDVAVSIPMSQRKQVSEACSRAHGSFYNYIKDNTSNQCYELLIGVLRGPLYCLTNLLQKVISEEDVQDFYRILASLSDETLEKVLEKVNGTVLDSFDLKDSEQLSYALSMFLEKEKILRKPSHSISNPGSASHQEDEQSILSYLQSILELDYDTVDVNEEKEENSYVNVQAIGHFGEEDVAYQVITEEKEEHVTTSQIHHTPSSNRKTSSTNSTPIDNNMNTHEKKYRQRSQGPGIVQSVEGARVVSHYQVPSYPIPLTSTPTRYSTTSSPMANVSPYSQTYSREDEERHEEMMLNPDCFERSIDLIEFYLLKIQEGITFTTHNASFSSIRNIERALNSFMTYSEDYQGEYDTYIQGIPDNLNNVIRSIRNRHSDHYDVEDYINKALAFCHELKLQIRPVNIRKIMNAYMTQGSIDQDGNLMNDIEGKDIVMLIGKTGVGKTTTVQFIAGARMWKEKGELGKHIRIDPSNLDAETQRQLQDFVTSVDSVSETRVVRTVDITLNDGRCFTICDTPGINDTEGVEMDILNGQLVLQALRSANSVKFLYFVCSSNAGPRFEGVKALPKTLLQFIPSLNRSTLQAIEYVFTRYDADDADVIKNQIRNILDNLKDEEKSDHDYLTVLHHMMTKTSPEAMIIQPEAGESNRLKLIERIHDLQPLSSRETDFKNFASSESLHLLNQQLQLHKEFILDRLHKMETDTTEHLEDSKGYEDEDEATLSQLDISDQSTVIMKIEEIQFLGEKLGFEQAKFTYKTVIKKLRSNYIIHIKNINRLVRYATELENHNAEIFIRDLKVQLVRAAKYEDIRSLFFSDMDSYYDLLQKIKRKMSAYMRDIQSVTFKDGIPGLLKGLLRLKKLKAFKDCLSVATVEEDRLLKEIYRLKNHRDFLLLLNPRFYSSDVLYAIEASNRRKRELEVSEFEEKAIEIINKARKRLGLKRLKENSEKYQITLERFRSLKSFINAFSSSDYDGKMPNDMFLSHLENCFALEISGSNLIQSDEQDISEGECQDDKSEDVSMEQSVKSLFLDYYIGAQNFFLNWQSAMLAWFKEYFDSMDGNVDTFIYNIQTCRYFKDHFEPFFGMFVHQTYDLCINLVEESSLARLNYVMYTLNTCISMDVQEGDEQSLEKKLKLLSKIDVDSLSALLRQYKRFSQYDAKSLEFFNEHLMNENINEVLEKIQYVFEISFSLMHPMFNVSKNKTMINMFPILQIQDRLIAILRTTCDDLNQTEKLNSIEIKRMAFVLGLRECVASLKEDSISMIDNLLESSNGGSYKRVAVDHRLAKESFLALVASIDYDDRIYKNEFIVLTSKFKDLVSIFSERFKSYKWSLNAFNEIPSDFLYMVCDFYPLIELEKIIMNHVDDEEEDIFFKGFTGHSVVATDNVEFKQEDEEDYYDSNRSDSMSEPKSEEDDEFERLGSNHEMNLKEVFEEVKRTLLDMMNSCYELEENNLDIKKMLNTSRSYWFFQEVQELFTKQKRKNLKSRFDARYNSLVSECERVNEGLSHIISIANSVSDEEIEEEISSYISQVLYLHQFYSSANSMFKNLSEDEDAFEIRNKLNQLWIKWITGKEKGFISDGDGSEEEKETRDVQCLYDHLISLDQAVKSIDVHNTSFQQISFYEYICLKMSKLDNLLPDGIVHYANIKEVSSQKSSLIKKSKKDEMNNYAFKLQVDDFIHLYPDFKKQFLNDAKEVLSTFASSINKKTNEILVLIHALDFENAEQVEGFTRDFISHYNILSKALSFIEQETGKMEEESKEREIGKTEKESKEEEINFQILENLKSYQHSMSDQIYAFFDSIITKIDQVFTKLETLVSERNLSDEYKILVILEKLINQLVEIQQSFESTKEKVTNYITYFNERYDLLKQSILNLKLSDFEIIQNTWVINFDDHHRNISYDYIRRTLDGEMLDKIENTKNKLNRGSLRKNNQIQRSLQILKTKIGGKYQELENLKLTKHQKEEEKKGSTKRKKKKRIEDDIAKLQKDIDQISKEIALCIVAFNVAQDQYKSLKKFLDQIKLLANQKDEFNEDKEQIYTQLSDSVKKGINFFKNAIDDTEATEEEEKKDEKKVEKKVETKGRFNLGLFDKDHQNSDSDEDDDDSDYDEDDDDSDYDDDDSDDGIDEEEEEWLERLRTPDEFIKVINKLEKNFFSNGIIDNYSEELTELKVLIHARSLRKEKYIKKIVKESDFPSIMIQLVSQMDKDIADMRFKDEVQHSYQNIMQQMHLKLEEYNVEDGAESSEELLNTLVLIWPSWHRFAFEIVPQYSYSTKMLEELRMQQKRQEEHNKNRNKKNRKKKKQQDQGSSDPSVLNYISSMFMSVFSTKETSSELIDRNENIDESKDEDRKEYDHDHSKSSIRSREQVRYDFISQEQVERYTTILFSLVKESFDKMIQQMNDNLSSISTTNLNILIKYKATLDSLFQLRFDYESITDTNTKDEHLYSYLSVSFKSVSQANIALETCIQAFSITLNGIKDKVKQFLVSIQQNFESYLNEYNFSEVIKLLNIVSMYNDELVELYRSDYLNDLSIVQEWKTYEQMKRDVKSMLTSIKEGLRRKIFQNSRAFSANISERRSYYESLHKQYEGMLKFQELYEDDEINISILGLRSEENVEDIKNQFRNNVAELGVQFLSNLELIPIESEDVYTKMQMSIDGLYLISNSFIGNEISNEAKEIASNLESGLNIKLTTIRNDISKMQNPDRIIDAICKLKMFSIFVHKFKTSINDCINRILDEVVNQIRLINLYELSDKLTNVTIPELRIYGQMIINDHNIFKDFIIEMRNKTTSQVNIQSVLTKLSSSDSTNIDIESLRYYYDFFSVNPYGNDVDGIESKDSEETKDSTIENCQGVYWKLVSEGMVNIDGKIKSIVEESRIIAEDENVCYKIKVLYLSAYIFAYWTLSNIDSSSDYSKFNEARFLRQPHSAQVISIFRLLGIDVSHEGAPKERCLKNHMVEIGTGEGKSVTLAVTSCILALLGYEVDCACYSSYLSERDYQAFHDLFVKFNVQEQVTYGTFNSLCEKMINSEGDIREMISSMINNRQVDRAHLRDRRRDKVILIDEVDIFFTEEFYGNMYVPITRIDHPRIRELIQYIWDNRNDVNLTSLQMMKSSSVYQSCLNEFKGWENLLEEALKALLVDVRSFDDPPYVLSQDDNGETRVGYKEQHGTSFKTFHRYKTIFAYMHEEERGEISFPVKEEQLTIMLQSGRFSYAEVPKMYQLIMGVTGTLSTLSKPEKKLLKEKYDINKYTYMPSMYMKQNITYLGHSNKYNMICEDEDFYIALQNHIKYWVEHDVNDSPRNGAVLVFLESNKVLDELFNLLTSDQTYQINGKRAKISTLTNENSKDEKDSIISSAASPGRITLCTREFGRGTDFISYDDRLNESGGVHVIQAFISTSLSEEMQVKGRTARQSNKGSYSLVVSHNHLDSIQMSEEDIARIGDEYQDKINEARSRFFNITYEASKKNTEELIEMHKESEAFADSLRSSIKAEALRYLVKENRVHYRASNTSGRTICLMDATGSMTNTLEGTKNRIHEMFQRVHTIFEERNFDQGFELQIVAYRNYNVDSDTIIQHSGWASDALSLQNFMNGVKPCGGWRNEAIETGFAYINYLIGQGENIAQVILIGDMPPNTREDVTSKRRRKGESYWQGCGKPYLSTPTYYEEELQKIIGQGIPVHAFYITSYAKDSFKAIAERSGGQSDVLHANVPSGAENLTNVVSMRILEQAGGEDFVQDYKDKFMGHIS